MKRMANLSFILMSVLVFSLSCKKDKEDDETKTNDNTETVKKNEMTYDGTKFDLNDGFILYGGMEHSGVYKMDLILSKGLILHGDENDIDSVSGIGDALRFELFSKDSTIIPSGDYSFDKNLTGNSGTFNIGEVFINIDFSQENDKATHTVTGGKITINKTESSYEITVECTDDKGKIISAYFKGSIELYKNDDVDKKNEMTYDGKNYNLEDGFIFYYGIDKPGVYDIDIVMSRGVVLHENGNDIDSVSGIGDAIWFDLFCKDSTKITDGEYTFDINQTDNPGTFHIGEFYINVDFSQDDDQNANAQLITGGKISVKKTDSTYEVIVDCTDSKGKDLTAYFKGTFKWYDFSDDQNKLQSHRFSQK